MSDLYPGTPPFFPALLAHVQDLAAPSLPLDAVVFQSILLCLIAGEKHLLLRAPERDVRLVVKLAFMVSKQINSHPLGHQIYEHTALNVSKCFSDSHPDERCDAASLGAIGTG